jgi:hypothetical protein
MVSIDLQTDPSFGSLECTYPINPKKKSFLNYKMSYQSFGHL